jgi:hypothetical protein
VAGRDCCHYFRYLTTRNQLPRIRVIVATVGATHSHRWKAHNRRGRCLLERNGHFACRAINDVVPRSNVLRIRAHASQNPPAFASVITSPSCGNSNVRRFSDYALQHTTRDKASVQCYPTPPCDSQRSVSDRAPTRMRPRSTGGNVRRPQLRTKNRKDRHTRHLRRGTPPQFFLGRDVGTRRTKSASMRCV